MKRRPGFCWICQRPLADTGQRGLRWTHYNCRALQDAGWRVAAIRARRSPQGEPRLKTRTETRNLACTLTEDELRDRGFQLAKAVQDIATEEMRQGDLKAQMKATLAGLDGMKSRLASSVARREEFRDVAVDIFLDHDRGVVDQVRQDTGECILSRPMTDDERQLALPVGVGE